MHVLAAALFFGGVASWLTWPLVARLGTALSSSPDSLLNYWALAWNYHVLPGSPGSYFDANIFAPRPDTLAYSEHLFGLATMVWPVYAVTGSVLTAYNAAVFLTFVLSGIGMYLLVHELTSSRWAALVSGTIYLAAPYRFLHLLHVQLLSLQWFPFVLWCLVRYLRTGKRRFVSGTVVFSLLQILSCNYYAVYLAYALALFGVVLVAVARSVLPPRRLAILAAGAATVATMSLPFFAPYLRNADRGFYRRYEDVVHFSARPADYLRPSAFHDAPHVRWLPRQTRSESALLPGLLALALAAVGVWAGFRERGDDAVRRASFVFLPALLAAAVILSFGPETGSGLRLPYYWLYQYAPGFSGMRVPVRISVLALVAVAALAGAGTSRLLRLVPGRESLAAGALVAVVLFESQTGSLERALPPAPEIPDVYAVLAEAEAPGAVLELPIHEGEAIIRESVYMYYSTAHWKPLVNGFSGWWPNDYWELVGRLRAFPTSRSLRFLLERAPVRYVVIHYDRFPDFERRRLEDAMHRYRDRMPLLVRVGDDAVYEITDGTAG